MIHAGSNREGDLAAGEQRGMSNLILTPKTMRKQIAGKVTYDEAQFGFPSYHNLIAISITGKGQHREEERDSSWGWNIREETEWGKFQEDLTRGWVSGRQNRGVIVDRGGGLRYGWKRWSRNGNELW